MTDDSGTKELRDFIKEIGKLPADLRKELRPALQRSAEKPLAEAKRNASWSRRIPGATKIAVSFSKRYAGVALKTSRGKAEHGRVYEHGGQPGTFRHRVFGHDVWVEAKARPFLWPAAKPWLESTDELVGNVVDTVARQYKFK